jgi:hypothetical protein
MDREINGMRQHRHGTSLFISLALSFLLSFSSIAGNDKTRISAGDSAFKARKTLHAIRIQSPPRIDGILDEPFWKEAPAGGDFVEYLPHNGGVPLVKTEMHVAYDDYAVYFAAVMYDPSPDSIFRELGKRDQVESLNTDYISFDILPYNDGINMFEFKVTPAGLQNDCKYSALGQDITWDAVWESAAKINAAGWVAEIAIPYSALRFPKTDIQVWGINFWRNFHRKNEFSTWSYIDINVQDIFKFYGDLTGISNIRPPVRFSVTPYLSAYLQQLPGSSSFSGLVRGGLDLRYGINESYTLDMMLVPDFGQVQSDDLVLNLSPFEIKYDEKRQFFTEGTELFNKCNIFYTRRIGSLHAIPGFTPDTLYGNETYSTNPDEARIINATKISGRNSKGLGIGFFNAMTSNTWATIRDTASGRSRRVLVQPFANYNVMVLDQNLKNSSYITLINTNFWSPEADYSSNVTGVESKIQNKKSTFSFFGRLNVSQKFVKNNSPDRGYQYYVSIARPSGKFQYQLVRQEINPHYDPNDMGFLTNNNQTNNQLKLGYYIYNPFWKILNTQTELYTVYSVRNVPYSFETLRFLAANSTSFKNFWGTYLEWGWYPLGYNDFYEARTPGYVYKMPSSYTLTLNTATNSRKKFRLVGTFFIMNSPADKHFDYYVEMVPRFRFTDKFTVSLDLSYERNMNSNGWVDTQTDSVNNPVVSFGRRDISTFANVLSAKYVFSTKTSLTLRLRHYWSTAKYLDFYHLDQTGYLKPADFIPGQDINYNAFTADMQFVWYFAPGSEIDLVWKNDINTQNSVVARNYWQDIKNTMNSEQLNSISVRILYWLDYSSLTKKSRNKKIRAG